MYNHEGYVAEATGDNVFTVRKGVVLYAARGGRRS